MRHLTTLVWFLTFGLRCGTAFAQGYGDYEGDGDVDGADFSRSAGV